MNSPLFIFNSHSSVLCWKPEMSLSCYSVNFLFCLRSFGSCLKTLWPGWDSFQDIGYCSWECNKQQNFGDRVNFPKGEGSRSHHCNHHYYCFWKYKNWNLIVKAPVKFLQFRAPKFSFSLWVPQMCSCSSERELSKIILQSSVLLQKTNFHLVTAGWAGVLYPTTCTDCCWLRLF